MFTLYPAGPALLSRLHALAFSLVTNSDVLSMCGHARSYNAEGGGGSGRVQQLGDNKLQLSFDPTGEA